MWTRLLANASEDGRLWKPIAVARGDYVLKLFAGFGSGDSQDLCLFLALTGGLRSRRVMQALIGDGTVDAIGMARPFVEFPDATQLILQGRADPIVLTPPSSTYGIHPITGYQAQLRRQARGEGFDPRMTNIGLVEQYLHILGHQAHATLRRTLRSAAR
jgi:hypothetical protein